MDRIAVTCTLALFHTSYSGHFLIHVLCRNYISVSHRFLCIICCLYATVCDLGYLQFAYKIKHYNLQCESKKIHPRGPDIFSFFHKRLIICNRFFTHLLNAPIFARLQIFIQLSPILTKLCHIKRDYPVHIICAKCPKRARSDVCVSR